MYSILYLSECMFLVPRAFKDTQTVLFVARKESKTTPNPWNKVGRSNFCEKLYTVGD